MKPQASPLKQCLLEYMAKYEAELLENPLLIAAVYFDPRYQRVLSADKKKDFHFDFEKHLWSMRVVDSL